MIDNLHYFITEVQTNSVVKYLNTGISLHLKLEQFKQNHKSILKNCNVDALKFITNILSGNENEKNKVSTTKMLLNKNNQL